MILAALILVALIGWMAWQTVPQPEAKRIPVRVRVDRPDPRYRR